MEWLAAILRPEDMAPHPHVPDREYDLRPHAGLAAAVLGDPRRSPSSWSNDGISAQSFDHSIVQGALKSFSSASIREGISELTGYARDAHCDLAEATSAALLASCALSELEQHQDVTELLQVVLGRVEASGNTKEHALLRLVLLLQVCLRSRDWGEDYSAPLAETRRLLDTLDPVMGIDRFEVGPAATGSSNDTIQHIVTALRYSSWSFERLGRGRVNESSTFGEFLRHPRSEQSLLLDQDASAQYSKTIESQFKTLFHDRSFVIGGATPDLFYVNLRYELAGSSQALTTRRMLALHRLVKGRSLGEKIDYAECLRLLRYSANADKELDLAVRGARLAGPLAALSQEVRQVILRRLTPQTVRYAELSVVAAAAELLTQSEASAALDQVIRLIDAGCPWNVAGRWTAFSRRAQETWRTAVLVARYADRTDELVMLLLRKISRSDAKDESLDFAYARTISSVDWDQVSRSVAERWRSWASTEAGKWPLSGDATRVKLGERVSDWDVTKELTLSAVGDVLNDAFRGLPLPEGFVERAAGTVSQAMDDLLVASKRGGPFGMGGVEPAACAAVLINSGASQLWGPLTDFLCDSGVPRAYRSAGFDQLVDQELAPPAEMLDRFRLVSDELMSARDRMPLDEDNVIPYPSALRFLGQNRILGPSELLNGLMRLAGAPELKARIEAAKSVAVLAATTPESWMSTIAIQLSHDDSGDIVGYCSNALALLLYDENAYIEAASQRLIELLNADGMIAPLLALRGLKKNRRNITAEIADEARRLSRMHPSRPVRNEAALVVDSIS